MAASLVTLLQLNMPRLKTAAAKLVVRGQIVQAA
jgi:hypothetical protein